MHDRGVRGKSHMTALELDEIEQAKRTSSSCNVVNASVLHTMAIRPGWLQITQFIVYYMSFCAICDSTFVVQEIDFNCKLFSSALCHRHRKHFLKITTFSTFMAAKKKIVRFWSMIMTEWKRRLLESRLSTRRIKIRSINIQLLSISLLIRASSSGNGNYSSSGGSVKYTNSLVIASLMLLYCPLLCVCVYWRSC